MRFECCELHFTLAEAHRNHEVNKFRKPDKRYG